MVWSLSPGNNTITIEAMDEAGNSATEELSVYYDQPVVDTDGGGRTEEEGLSWVWGAVFVAAAVTVIVTAVFVTAQRRR